MKSEIARGYAESLYGLAKVENMEDRFEDELFELKKSLQDSYQLREFLADRKIPAERKREAFREILSPAASSILRNALNVLIDQGRAHLIQEVAEETFHLIEKEKNRVLAEVVTAVPLTPEMEQKISARLSKITGKNVSIKNVVDEEVMGGIVVKMEGKILDLSIKKRLLDLKNQMEVTSGIQERSPS